MHRAYTHRERAWKLALQSGDTPHKQRRLGSTEDRGYSPVKLEFSVTACTGKCPVCGQTFGKVGLETHISAHDPEVASAYSGLRDSAKLKVAELVLEMTTVRKTEA